MSTTHRSSGANGRQSARWVLACVLALLVLAAPVMAAAQPLTGTFAGKGTGREVSFTHNGKQRSDWAGTLKLALDDGPTIPVFCIEIDVRVTTGNRYKSDGPVLALPNGCQIRYLLDKYPASTAKTPDEAAARQFAIWAFSDGLDPAGIGEPVVRDRTVALVDEAKSGPCPNRRTEAPNLTIQPPTATSAPGQPIAYTIIAGPADAGKVVTLSVAAPASLANAQQQPAGQRLQLTLDAQGAGSFWVLSPSAGQTAVNASLPYRLETGTVFSPLDDNRKTQRLVSAEAQSLTARATARATWSGQAPPPATQPPATQPPATQPPRSERPTEQRPPQEVLATAVATVVSEASTKVTPVPAPSPMPTQVAPPPSLPAQPAGGAPIGQPAGGVPNAPPASDVVRPSRLPNTGEPEGANASVLTLVLLLIVTGWMLRRAVARR
jgi:hypothetical protein